MSDTKGIVKKARQSLALIEDYYFELLCPESEEEQENAEENAKLFDDVRKALDLNHSE